MLSTNYSFQILLKLFLKGFKKNTRRSNFMKLRSVGAELFHSDGHTTKIHAQNIYIIPAHAVPPSNPIKYNLYFTNYLVTAWSDSDLYMAQSPLCKQHMQMFILWCTGDPHSPWSIGSRKPLSETTVGREFLTISQWGHAVINHTHEIIYFFLFYT
jgi:hypothetical protein